MYCNTFERHHNSSWRAKVDVHLSGLKYHSWHTCSKTLVLKLSTLCGGKKHRKIAVDHNSQEVQLCKTHWATKFPFLTPSTDSTFHFLCLALWPPMTSAHLLVFSSSRLSYAWNQKSTTQHLGLRNLNSSSFMPSSPSLPMKRRRRSA